MRIRPNTLLLSGFLAFRGSSKPFFTARNSLFFLRIVPALQEHSRNTVSLSFKTVFQGEMIRETREAEVNIETACEIERHQAHRSDIPRCRLLRERQSHGILLTPRKFAIAVSARWRVIFKKFFIPNPNIFIEFFFCFNAYSVHEKRLLFFSFFFSESGISGQTYALQQNPKYRELGVSGRLVVW